MPERLVLTGRILEACESSWPREEGRLATHRGQQGPLREVRATDEGEEGEGQRQGPEALLHRHRHREEHPVQAQQKKKPEAVATGEGVTFGEHVEIDGVESLKSFLFPG